MKKMRYAVVTIKRYATLKGAKENKELTSAIVKVSPYGVRCPKGADHAHAMYDGATYCRSCGQYLSLRIETKP